MFYPIICDFDNSFCTVEDKNIMYDPKSPPIIDNRVQFFWGKDKFSGTVEGKKGQFQDLNINNKFPEEEPTEFAGIEGNVNPQLFGKNSDEPMILLKNNIYCKKSSYDDAVDASRKSATSFLRRLMDGVFKRNAILNCTYSGRPPRAQGKDRQSEKFEALDRIARKAVEDHNQLVLRKLNAIIKKLELVDDRLHNLTIKSLGIDDTVELEETETLFPIEEEETLTMFEDRLKHETGFRTKMISMLKGIGGQDMCAVTTGILKRIWTDSLASTYSMLGRKQKKIFRNLATYKLVIDTVRVHRPSATEDQVQELIAKWLVHAPLRHTRANKPKEDTSLASTTFI